MQVISGKFRARRLKSPDSARPTLQRIKISTFSLINEFVKGDINVLDLFAGSGALGIECISRGAKFVQFVEKDKMAVVCIKQNLRGIDSSLFSVLNTEYIDALKSLRNGTRKFDIVFIDPPYESGYYGPAVEILTRYDLVADGGILVLEMNKSSVFKFDDKKYSLYKEREYGITKIMILRKI